MPRKQHSYSIKTKLAALDLIEKVRLTATVAELQYPHGTVDGWWRERVKLRAFIGNKLSKMTKGQGCKESFPFTPALVTFMKDTRREEEWLTTSTMIGFIEDNYVEWLQRYSEGKKSQQSCRRALERLLQRTAKRYGFSTQKAQETKLPCLDLDQIKQDFAIEFWATYSSFWPSEIYNMDETAINFDMPPARTWGVKGRNGSAKVQDLSKHCGRMTAVLTIRADGKKLPILFILRGKLGVTIESKEIGKLPKGHFYTVQEAGWMDSTGWQFYNENLQKYNMNGPALLLVDNLRAMCLSKECALWPKKPVLLWSRYPPKSTSVCQPLDVGVMGPLKARIRGCYIPKKGFSAPEKRLRAIKSTIKAWEEFPEEQVIRSFQKAIPRIEAATV